MAEHNSFNLGLCGLLQEEAPNRIRFIKLIRESLGCTLREAKDMFDKIDANLNTSPEEDALFRHFTSLRVEQQNRLIERINDFCEVVEF